MDRNSPGDQGDQIFEPFYQVDDSSTQPYGGIGLASVKDVVEIHGGQVTVQSVEGVGSAFQVRLPVSQHVAGEMFLDLDG